MSTGLTSYFTLACGAAGRVTQKLAIGVDCLRRRLFCLSYSRLKYIIIHSKYFFVSDWLTIPGQFRLTS